MYYCIHLIVKRSSFKNKVFIKYHTSEVNGWLLLEFHIFNKAKFIHISWKEKRLQRRTYIYPLLFLTISKNSCSFKKEASKLKNIMKNSIKIHSFTIFLRNLKLNHTKSEYKRKSFWVAPFWYYFPDLASKYTTQRERFQTNKSHVINIVLRILYNIFLPVQTNILLCYTDNNK